jgi:hypothetical protein
MTRPIALTVSDTGPADRASYPIGFALRDDDGLAVLVITDDPAEQHAHLEITNTTGAGVGLDPIAGKGDASADRHHFELRFRPGVLSTVSQQRLRLEEQDGWSATPPQRQPDGTVSMYLLSTTTTVLGPSAPIRLRLRQISADGTGGARGTQVELRYRGLRYADGTPLADTKLLHLDIVNQRGKKNIPLHVGFAGTHTVLNDGRTANALTVRLTNVSSTDLPLTGQQDAAPSTFIISFDADQSWGLATRDALRASTLEAIDGRHPGGTDWQVLPGRQLGTELAWTLRHRDDTVLAAGQVIQLRLGGIVSNLPGGDTNLYLRYENIPGYWDGQFVCTIEKGPIRYDERGNVGIATATPARALQVGDDAGGLGFEPASGSGTDGYLRFGDNTGRRLHIARSRESTGGALNTGTAGALVTVEDSGRVGIGTHQPVARLTVQADSVGSAEGRQVVVRGNTDPRDELAIGFHTQRRYGSLQATAQGTAVRPLLLNPAGGGVGVGLNRAPTTALEVNGGIRSPMWQVIKLLGSVAGPLPVHSDYFETGGGTLLLFVSGSAYRSNAGPIGLRVAIDDHFVDEFSRSINPANQHVPLSDSLVLPGVPAGTHRLNLGKFSDAPDMRTDENDYFSVTLLELPF